MKSSQIAAAALAAISSGAAAEERLSGNALEHAVAGAIVEIDTPLGTRLPVHYGRQGRLNGHARSLASYLGASSDTGRWWVASDQLCHKWERWFAGQTQCLRVTREGSTLRWHQLDGTSGTATIISRDAIASDAIAASAAATASSLPGTVGSPASAAPVASSPVEPRFTLPADAAAPARPASSPPANPRPTTTAATAAPQRPPAREAAPVTRLSEPASGMPTWRVVAVAPDDVLNVREGPSAEHPSVGALAPSVTGVTISGACRGGWCPIAHAGLNGWVNRRFLESESREPAPSAKAPVFPASRDSPEAPRSCLTGEARALLDRIEARFGPVQVVSTCRPGARIAGSGRISRHASGNAVDFEAGARKAEIVAWLIANHTSGGTMTYAGLEHVHVDIGPHFVALDVGSRSGRRWRSASRQPGSGGSAD